MTPVIRLERAVVLLGRFPALAGADLVVERGEIVHLAGPNGAGKSTLLRTCAGLHRLTGGVGEVLGADLTNDRARRTVRRRIGLVGHDGALYDDLTVEENVRFAVRAAGVAEPDATTRTNDALERLALDGRLRREHAGRLSAGQRRRAAIATTIAKRTDLWLLDEPHAGLDAANRDVIDDLVRAAANDGVTVLFASHERDRAADLAGRMLVVAGGEVHHPHPEPANA